MTAPIALWTLEMLFEIFVVLALTLLNGVLAMSELAIVSARTARLKVMAAKGNRGARAAMQLAADPGRFLSSVQIGITLVGVLSGAFSGATLGLRLAGALEAAGVNPAMAQGLGVGSVVVLITYISLIFGELVPKQIALRAPEAVAVRIAPLLKGISVLAAPIVWVLDKSGKLVLALIGQSGTADRNMTDEEVRLVLAEARTAGVLEKAETDMIAGVMRIADRTARGLMVPRGEVELVDASDSPATIIGRFRNTGRTRLLVRDGSPDDVVGVIRSLDFLDVREPGPAHEGQDAPWHRLIVETPAVLDGMDALDVVDVLRKAPAHMVLVYDEHGHFEGIVTPMDILEAIAGEFPEDGAAEAKILQREDGSFLVSGWMPVDEFAERFGITLGANRDFETVAGFVLDQTGVLPRLGEHFVTAGWRIEVIDMDGRRIDKLLVSKAIPAVQA